MSVNRPGVATNTSQPLSSIGCNPPPPANTPPPPPRHPAGSFGSGQNAWICKSAVGQAVENPISESNEGPSPMLLKHQRIEMFQFISKFWQERWARDRHIFAGPSKRNQMRRTGQGRSPPRDCGSCEHRLCGSPSEASQTQRFLHKQVGLKTSPMPPHVPPRSATPHPPPPTPAGWAPGPSSSERCSRMSTPP